MERVRRFEERVRTAFVEGLVHGTTHLCIGQEAVCSGVVEALRPDDYLTYTYRGHGVCIARGMSMRAAFAEIFGRVTGVAGGLGGSMHLTDPDLNLIGAAGIVGAGLPLAVGAALSAQRAGEGPTFLECRTYRHAGHSRTDPGKYRPAEEVASWLARDPLPAFEQRLLSERICDSAELQRLKTQVADEVQHAAQEAAAAQWPTPRDYLTSALVRG